MKKFLVIFLCGILLLCISACKKTNINDNTQSTESIDQNDTNSTENINDNTQSTESTNQNETGSIENTDHNTESTESTNENGTNNQEIAIFNTKNIKRITFYAYYGSGKGSKVPSEKKTEIKTWLDSFTIVREATDDDALPGTNNYCVEIEYMDGTIIKEGLDIIIIDGTRYLLEKEPYPDCFRDIISKTSLN